MSDYESPNIDETVRTAWETAEQVCFDYLCYIGGLKSGYNAFIGDSPEDTDKKNIVAFMISGGQEQVQNYQCPTPNHSFIADGHLAGIYQTRKEALAIGGAIMNGMPAYWTDDEDDEAVPDRGLEPNVSFFELTEHPECFSFKEEGKGRVWLLVMQFRCCYTDTDI